MSIYMPMNLNTWTIRMVGACDGKGQRLGPEKADGP